MWMSGSLSISVPCVFLDSFPSVLSCPNLFVSVFILCSILFKKEVFVSNLGYPFVTFNSHGSKRTQPVENFWLSFIGLGREHFDVD